MDAGAGFKAYEWSTSEKTQTINVTNIGTYFVKVTDANGCNGMDTIEIKYDPAGITFFENTKIKVYPNPAKSLLNIESENLIIDKIEVFAINGCSIYRNIEASRNFKLNVSDWADGLYILALWSNGKAYNYKITIQN